MRKPIPRVMFFSRTPLGLTALFGDDPPTSSEPPCPGSMTTVPFLPMLRLRHGRSDSRHDFPYGPGYTYAMRLILAAALVSIVSCSSSPTEPAEASDAVNVRFGQTVTVAGTRISFTEVNESRCPK